MLENSNNVIFIGKKPLMTYFNSALLRLSEIPSIKIKARGSSIVVAVDVAQTILHKTNSFEIGKIQIDSESLESSDGRKRNVSTIEIPIRRNP